MATRELPALGVQYGVADRLIRHPARRPRKYPGLELPFRGRTVQERLAHRENARVLGRFPCDLWSDTGRIANRQRNTWQHPGNPVLAPTDVAQQKTTADEDNVHPRRRCSNAPPRKSEIR
jgi:hypothetical protein